MSFKKENAKKWFGISIFIKKKTCEKHSSVALIISYRFPVESAQTQYKIIINNNKSLHFKCDSSRLIVDTNGLRPLIKIWCSCSIKQRKNTFEGTRSSLELENLGKRSNVCISTFLLVSRQQTSSSSLWSSSQYNPAMLFLGYS